LDDQSATAVAIHNTVLAIFRHPTRSHNVARAGELLTGRVENECGGVRTDFREDLANYGAYEIRK
jgi:hypothetical protein